MTDTSGGVSRLDVLRLSATGAGTVAVGRRATVLGRGQTGSVGPGDLPPLRKAYFLVRDDGNIDWDARGN